MFLFGFKRPFGNQKLGTTWPATQPPVRASRRAWEATTPVLSRVENRIDPVVETWTNGWVLMICLQWEWCLRTDFTHKKEMANRDLLGIHHWISYFDWIHRLLNSSPYNKKTSQDTQCQLGSFITIKQQTMVWQHLMNWITSRYLLCAFVLQWRVPFGGIILTEGGSFRPGRSSPVS